jgi:WS/DGAT/MGAT family acyltransferase
VVASPPWGGSCEALRGGSIMERMSPLDAGFLDLEDADRHASLAIASIAILEGPAPSYEEFLAAVAGRLPLMPRYRQKVRQIPFDLGRPVWVDDPGFDLRYHLRQTALPAPGGQEQLRHLIERVMAQRLDRERPLWESWLVEGLEGGNWAVLTKVHHSVMDGVSGVDLFRLFFDAQPEPFQGVDDDWRAGPEPSTLRLTAAALGELAFSPVEQVRALRSALRTPAQLVQRTLDTARGLATLAGAVVPTNVSSLSGPIGRSRRYRWVGVPFADITTVRGQLGGTVNDVALAAITGAFRRLLLARGEQPGAHVVRTLVPVSVRGPGEQGVFDNRVSLLLADLPVEVADPAERLEAVHIRMAALKASKEAEAGEAMTQVARYEPFPLLSLGLRLLFRVPQRNIVTVTTNVPGPPWPLYALGRRVLVILPYVPIATTVRIGIAILSYCDQVTFGITGDRDSSPDIDVLVDGIQDSLAELVAAAQPKTAPARRKTVARRKSAV